MCIRDSYRGKHKRITELSWNAKKSFFETHRPPWGIFNPNGCLLYTSDAADERSSVDLGGRRIIKKKKKIELARRRAIYKKNQQHQNHYNDKHKHSLYAITDTAR